MQERIEISLRIAHLIEDFMQSGDGLMNPELKEWIEESDANRELFARITKGNDWQEKLARLDRMQKATSWSDLQRKRKRDVRKLWMRTVQFAAVLVFTLLVGGVAGYFISSQKSQQIELAVQRYSSMKGSISVFELPDSTKIWLNSDSEISYSEDLKNKRRLVSLKGEAYFEVTHREDCPMEVSVGQLVIRDLGTSFNIKAYPGSPVVETSLMEGKVDILSERGKSIVALEPGEIARFDSNNKTMDVSTFSPHIVSAWKDGKFVIRDQRMEDIFSELSHWYNVKFIFENPDLKDFRYTGIIRKSTTVEHVLKMLKETTHINYRIKDMPSGMDEVVIY